MSSRARPAPEESLESKRIALLDLAERAHASDELYRARIAYQTLLELDPGNPVAKRGVAEVDAEIVALCRARKLQGHRILRLAVPVESVPDEMHGAEEGAILAVLMAGDYVSLADCLARIAMPELQAVETIIRLVDRGLVVVW